MSYGNSSSATCPSFDGKGESFARYGQGAESRNPITNLDDRGRIPELVSQMTARAPEIRMASATPKLIAVNCVEDIAKELSAYCAPGALGTAYQHAVTCLKHNKTTANIGN